MKRKSLTICSVCNRSSMGRINGKEYCKKHFMQIYRHGHTLDRTIFDKNEWIFHDDYAECVTYDKNFNVNGKVKFDLDDYEKLKDKKIYICSHNGKMYAIISMPNLHKILAHRFVMNLHEEEYTIRRVIDHINGDSLDNRKHNLRVCSQKENMTNIRKKDKIVGVNKLKNGRFSARLMKDYKSLDLGVYDTFEDAILARIIKEKELCGEFGSNKDLFYVLNTANPINEIKKYLKKNDTNI